uniref:Uncharacterized protein n=1 Tax=Podoviridae sp. ctFkM10 TaxID=2826548 RepID=A0A8S5NDN3_9CAUD|nr:MAG TPA: hypothetical protein [Podoviridae sp. ctFkM10]
MSKIKRLVNPDTGEILDPKETPEYYTLDAIRHADVWTDENINAEYARLRKIAQERLRVISKSDIGRASKTWYYNQNRFKPTSELRPYERKILLAEVAKMMQAETGTLAGIKRQRRKAIQTFHEHGYTFVDESNFIDIGEFFREWKDSEFRGYGSTVALDFYEKIKDSEAFERATQRVDKSAQLLKDFKEWKAHREEPHERKNNENEKSSADLFKELDEFL